MPVRPSTLWLPLVLTAATLAGAATTAAQAPYIPPAPYVPPVVPQFPSAGFQAAQNHAQHDRMMSQQSTMRYQQQQHAETARRGQEWAYSNGGSAQQWAGGGANFAMPQFFPMQPWQHPLQAVDYHSLSTHQKFQYRVAMRRLNRALAAMRR